MAARSIDTPVGVLTLQSNGEAISRVFWSDSGVSAAIDETDSICDIAAEQLLSYFFGHRKQFTEPVSLVFSYLTLKSWRPIRAVPPFYIR